MFSKELSVRDLISWFPHVALWNATCTSWSAVVQFDANIKWNKTLVNTWQEYVLLGGMLGFLWESERAWGGTDLKLSSPPPPQVNRLLLLLRPAGDVWTFSCRLPLNSHFSPTKCSLTPSSSSSGTSSSPSCPHSLWVMWLWRSINLDLPGKRKTTICSL